MPHTSLRSQYGVQKIKTALMASAAVLVFTTTANAQGVMKGDENTIILEPISIDAKADVITGGVQLTSDDIDQIDPASIKDVFRQEPGVNVGSPVGVSHKIYVHGIEDSNLAVDVDGARQANKTYHHIGTTLVDPSVLKSVKVETGVAPADAGPGALAGSISLETKDGRDFVDLGETFGGFMKLGYNSNTDGFSEDIALATRIGNIDILAYGTQERGSSNYKDGNSTTINGTKPGVDNALFKIGVTGTDGYRLKFSANQFRDIGVRSARPNFVLTAHPAGTGPMNVDYRRKNFTLSFGDETPSDMLDPKVSLSYTTINVDTIGARNVVADTSTLNGKASNTFTTDLGKFTAGGDFYIDKGEGGYTGTLYNEKIQNFGLFTQARISPFEDFRTSFGGRVDHNKVNGNDDSNQSFTGLSGNANIEYDITNEVMGYAGLGTKFGSIPLTEVGVQDALYDYNGVTPSRSYNYKAGLVYDNNNLTLDGQIYLTKIDDAVDPINNSNDTRVEYDDITSRGYSLSAKYNYGAGFIRGGYSRTKLRVNSGRQATQSASYTGLSMGHMFNFEASHDLAEYGVRLGSTNEWALRNDEYAQELDGYFVSNIYAEWMPEEIMGLSIRGDVKNLFDRTYADRANIGADYVDSAAVGVEAYNDPGRTFLISAKYDF